MDYIYVFELENGKFYIDKINKPNIVLTSDNNWIKYNNNEWIKQNNIIKILLFYKSYDIFEVNNLTKIYMMKYGIDNVRGGIFQDIKLNEHTIELLKKEFKFINNIDNFVNNFYTKTTIIKEINKLEQLCEQYDKLHNKIFFISNGETPITLDVLSENNYNEINKAYNILYPNSFLLNNNSTIGMTIKTKKIFIHNNMIIKEIDSLLSSHELQFNDIDEVYNTIDQLLDKEIELNNNSNFSDDNSNFSDDKYIDPFIDIDDEK